MRAEVRDDIIKLETFVAIKFKYEKYIDMIHEAGGYCFLSQFAYHYGNNEGRYIAKQLEDAGLIKTKAVSNYKYCYLTDVAIKYLKLKDSKEDYSDKSKNQINVKRLSVTPSDKVLLASAIKFALIHKYKFIGKKCYEEKSIKAFSEFYGCDEDRADTLKCKIDNLKMEIKKEAKEDKRIFENHIKPLFQIYKNNTDEEYEYIKNKIAKLEVFIEEKNKRILHIKNLKQEEDELKQLKIKLGQLIVINQFKKNLVKQKNDLEIKIKTKNEYIQKQEKELEMLSIETTQKAFKVSESVKKAISYYDKSKIIFTLNNKKAILNMIIIDTGTLKKSYGYIDVLNKFSIETETEKLYKRIHIASYSEKRGKKLQEQLNKILIEKKTKLKKIEDYKCNIDMSKYTPEFYKNAEKFINKVPDFTVELMEDGYYIEPYKEPVSAKTGYIKPKDKDRFEEIKNRLNNR
ncbi:hypothetical protein OW763_16395 [Clostridium aestuarii]|uniref:Uncharacterized protein n=1 Tax=Clostridium aestuarii TaxID=338193 RepID=A0ABT4D431_9CLOT|nr:hypothetical protein [Clostridium aestuarii]MCY6485892.1 hypothetical protein [Clostridium aestuarii]